MRNVLFGLVAMASAWPAYAADKVTVAITRSAGNLPYFIAQGAGYFKKYDIEIEPKVIVDNALVIASIIGDQIDAGSILAIDGMNANLKKPGTVNWIVIQAQNEEHRMEQFVTRKGANIKTIADLKGAKIVSAPGLGNLSLAKAALAKAGLKEGDYQLSPMDPGQHINVITSGQFDAAYTLEPGGTIMVKKGVADLLQSGLIADVVLGSPKAAAFVGGVAISGTLLTKRPDVAKRYAQAYADAVALIRDNPAEARKYLIGNTPIPDDIIGDMPLILYKTVAEATAEDKANLQKYLDFAQSFGALSEKVDIAPYLKSL
jgi:NitT/TauT family transport system substrate-binding protein